MGFKSTKGMKADDIKVEVPGNRMEYMNPKYYIEPSELKARKDTYDIHQNCLKCGGKYRAHNKGCVVIS